MQGKRDGTIDEEPVPFEDGPYGMKQTGGRWDEQRATLACQDLDVAWANAPFWIDQRAVEIEADDRV
jgi:hypothetical protein